MGVKVTVEDKEEHEDDSRQEQNTVGSVYLASLEAFVNYFKPLFNLAVYWSWYSTPISFRG